MRNLVPSKFISRLLLGNLGLVGIAFSAAASDLRVANQVLAVDQQIYALEQQRIAPGTADFTVFIGSQRNELRLRKLSLRIDDLPPVLYEYSQAEWEAIAAGGLHPAWTGPLSAGEHRLRMELFARTLDAGPTDPRAVERLDRTITVAPGGAIELSMAQERFGKSSLSIVEWADNTPVLLGNPAHPWLRAGEFWLGAGRPYFAARMYKRLQLRSPGASWANDANALLAASLQQLAGTARTSNTAIGSAEHLQSAIAALGAGNPVALETLGTQDAESMTEWVARDRANLLVGYHYLRQGAGEAALKALGRVRSPGPYGNEALLGFGWAFLIPEKVDATAVTAAKQASAQQPVFVAAAGSSKGVEHKDRKKALERALVPWTELVGGDPLDPAAQEGALALAWALDELGTGGQAHIYYERSAKQLEMARGLLDRAMEHVASGGTASAVSAGENDAQNGWRTWLADLPYADDTAYLKYLLAEPAFVDRLDAYRGARLLHDELDACSQRLERLASDDDGRIPAIAAQLQTALAESANIERDARSQMERVALDHLRAQKQRTEQYLVEARFAMARHFDNLPGVETELKREPVEGGAS